MEIFSNNQRVIVTDSDNPLIGEAGKVVRLRRSDRAAWVNMDRDVPEGLRSFPSTDPDGRANHVILYPWECEEANEIPDQVS